MVMPDDIMKRLCFSALLAAMVCIATLFFKVPIPLGYAHLGNGFILLGCSMMGGYYGIFIAGFGSALADLLGGFGQWILPTLVIKGLMGFAVGRIADPDGTGFRLASVRSFLAAVVGTPIMVAGYTLFGALLSGSLAAGLAQIPGLVGEGIVGIIVFYISGAALRRISF